MGKYEVGQRILCCMPIPAATAPWQGFIARFYLSPRTSYRLIIGQAGLVVAILLFSALAPRSGSPALMVPLPGVKARQMFAFAQTSDFRIVGAGAVRGSIVVSGAGPSRMWGAVMHGALLIAVPALLCQTRTDGLSASPRRIYSSAKD